MEDIEMKISQLVDNELSDIEQIEVFCTLAKDQKARLIYSELHKLKKEVAKHHSEVQTDLFPLRIYQAAPGFVRTNIFKIGFAFSTVAAIVLLMMLLSVAKQINNQSLENESLISTGVISSDSKSVTDRVVINNSSLKHNKSERRVIQKNMIYNFKKSINKMINNDVIVKSPDDEIQTIQLTKNDFLISQVVGN